MKTTALSLVMGLLIAVIPSASANIDQFAGKWKNVNLNTRGLTTLNIEVRGKRLRIEAWGKCHPTDCAWGYAEGTTYAPSVEANPAETALAATTLYITSFKQTILVIRPIEGGQLKVETFTKFTDESARADYTAVETFSRVEGGDAGQ
jgi:hypothetical protein